MSPLWVPAASVRAIHSALLREHGGLPGPPGESALESTLARPRQLLSHVQPAPSLPQLAAAYGFGLAKNHCFPDGNKRIALAGVDVFLQLNDFEKLLVRGENTAVLGGERARQRTQCDHDRQPEI